MKFMIQWTPKSVITPAEFDAVVNKFSHMTAADDSAMDGPQVKTLGRWHKAACSGEGISIVEAESLTALSKYLSQWKVFNFTVEPVLTDDEFRATFKQ